MRFRVRLLRVESDRDAIPRERTAERGNEIIRLRSREVDAAVRSTAQRRHTSRSDRS